MAGVMFSILKSLSRSINPSFAAQTQRSSNSYFKLASYAYQNHVKLFSTVLNNTCDKSQLHSVFNSAHKQFRVHGCIPTVDILCYKTNAISAFSPTSKKLSSQSLATFVSFSPFVNPRSYSSYFGSKTDKPGDLDVPAASSGTETDVSNIGIGGSDSFNRIKDAWQSVVDAATYTGKKAEEASNELSPYVEKLLDTHPYLRDVVVPVSCYLTGTILAWVVMPRVLRRFYKYAMQGPVSLLYGSLSAEQIPYEKSFWGALEDPVRYLITFMAFVQMSVVPHSAFPFWVIFY